LKEEWCIPPKASGAFVAAMEDVLEVYHRPYDPQRPQICMDETSKTLHAHTRPPEPPRPAEGEKPARPAREDYEYIRNGSANLFLWFEPLTGRRRVKATERRTRQDWAELIRELVDEAYPEAEKIVLVLDNLNTHTLGSLYETFAPEEARRLAEKLELHYTPKHGSWLNMAEIELSVLARQCLGQRLPSRAELADAVAAWEADRNARAATMQWRFTTADARIKLKHLYPKIQP
jgi:transposase